MEAHVSASDGLWEDTDLAWMHDVDVRLRATYAGTGEVVARGNVTGELSQECTRCLQKVSTEFAHDVTLVFVEAGGTGDEAGGAYVFGPNGSELDLGSAVREEIVLAVNPYVVCRPECQGLCATCGADLNDGPCDCTGDESDPRWDALRKLKEE